MKPHKANRLTKWLAAAGALLPLVAVPIAGATVELPFPGRATVLTVFPWEGSLDDELQGSLCQTPNTCVPVDTFLWDPNGVAQIDTAIDSTPGDTILFGYSQGAVMVTRWLQQHAGDVDAPSPEELSIVLIGNSTRAYGGANADFAVMPQTQYHVIDVARQYDPAADYPDDPFNLLAVANAWAGFTTIHTDYEGVDINDPANAVWTVGNTTYVLVPTENLPLLESLRMIGLTELADELNGPLKEIIEQGYNRPVPFPTTTQPAPPDITPTPTASMLSTSVVSTPTVGPPGATVPVRHAPTPAAAADSAPRSTRLENADGASKGVAVADTLTTTTPPANGARGVGTGTTITPAGAQPRLDNAIAAKHATSARTTHTPAASTTDGNKAEPGQVRSNRATTKSGEQARSTEHSENSALREE
ncbi:MAG: hypothetical protein QOG75_3578 [Mycobacterium sp.]|nr:hypothetical protein [Mycobacterium sp.]